MDRQNRQLIKRRKTFRQASLLMGALLFSACNLKSQSTPLRATVVEDLGTPPSVASVSPTKYGVRGGATLTVNGNDFTASSTISLGGSPCTSPTFVSSSQMTCTIGYHGAAVVDVVVTNPDGQTGTLLNGFKYNAFLYATNGSNDRIYAFEIDAQTRTVTEVAYYPTCDYPYGVEVDPANRYVYVACYTGAKLQWFSINHASATLTYEGEVNAGPTPRQLAGISISPDGKYLATGSFATAVTQAYSINSGNGALTYLAEAAAGGIVSLVAFDPLSQYYFSANYGNSSVTKFKINEGPFSISNIQTVSTNIAPVAATTNPDGIFVHPSGRYVYTGSANATGRVASFSFDPAGTGTLAKLDSDDLGFSGASGSGVVVDPSGSHVYVTARGSSRVVGYNVSLVDGSLSPMTPTTSWATGTAPNDVRIQSLGDLLVTANVSARTITTYVRDPGTGQLSSRLDSAVLSGTGSPAPEIIAITY